MTLLPNWPAILRHAWSIRLILLAALLSGLEVALAIVGPFVPVRPGAGQPPPGRTPALSRRASRKMNLRLSLYMAVAVVMASLVGFSWLQIQRVESMRNERDQAVSELAAANRAITAMAAERVAADRRQAIAGSAREAIVAAPATDDGPVSPVLARALAAADEIGGVR